MSILIGVAWFLVWYLVSILTGVFLLVIDGENWRNIDSNFVPVFAFVSIFGPFVWLIIFTADRMNNKAV